MTHELNLWKQYLNEKDHEYLINYVDNIKNNILNYKLLILLGNEGANGKSTLINQISNYIGKENFRKCDTYGSAFLEPIVKLVHIPAINDYKKKYIQQLINVIQYGQSVIAETNDFDKIDKDLLNYVKIIHMDHRFIQ